MAVIKVTLSNRYIPFAAEEFYCIDLDISDLEEVENCVDECCGQFVDLHHDIISALHIDDDLLAESFTYIIEEVDADECI